MKKYCARIPVGIGDIIYIRAQLDAVKDRFDAISLSPDPKRFRDRAYGDFVIDWMNTVFNCKPYNVCIDKSYPFKTSMDMWKKDNIFPQKPRLSEILCTEDLPDILSGKKYIALSTKVRDIRRNHFNKFEKSMFAKLLSLKNLYFVILGEREILKTDEYENRNKAYSKIYSIYNNIIANIPGDRYIDLSIDNFKSSPLNVANILKDCSILRAAEQTINIGVGGAFCMASAVSNNALSLMNMSRNEVGKHLFLYRQYNDIFVTGDFPEFISKIGRKNG